MDASHILLTVIETLPEPHCILSHDLRCVALNSRFAKLLGTTVEELKGCNAALFWSDVAKVVWGTHEFPAEFSYRDSPPVVVKLATWGSELLVVRVLASFSEDQTPQIFQAQKLETLGLLAGGVAHDINNVLTGIFGHLAYLQTILPPTSESAESLMAIEEGAKRASGITGQILSFSRMDEVGSSQRVDLVDLVTRVGALLKGAIPPRIEVRWAPPSSSPEVLSSEAHLTQILINLMVNARDAIKNEGVITVSVEPRCSRGCVRDLFGPEPASSAYCALVVQDDGEGMTEAVKARLFEPYFTTKKGGGTGLGLATVHAIVKKLGGAIEVRSERGVGTEFRVALPLLLEEEEALGEGACDDDRSGPVMGQGERILVVDDEPTVRSVLGLSLSHLGYVVETASSGLEAMEKFQAVGGAFDLVILDMLMPGLSGEEVFNRLRRLQPTLPVILVSGFSSAHVVARVLENGGSDFIQKPFSIELLAQKVRTALCEVVNTQDEEAVA
jgi:two-component system cell cycle sensor histidine kinase/response regulator CckA